MKRLATFAAGLGLFPSAALAQELAPPTPAVPLSQQASPVTSPPRPVKPLPGTTVTAPPAYMYAMPTPAAPTVGPVTVDDCGRVSGCPDGPRSRLFGGFSLFGRSDCDAKSCRPGLPHRGGCAPDRGGWEKFKSWVCWSRNYEQTMPCFRPIPYQSRLTAYYPPCSEPKYTVAQGGCQKGGYQAGGCAVPGCGGGNCGHARPAIGGRVAGLLKPGPKYAHPCPAGDEATGEIGPGLRFANPLTTPTPQAQQATNGQPVSTPPAAGGVRPWPGVPQTQAAPVAPASAVSRPFTNP